MTEQERLVEIAKRHDVADARVVAGRVRVSLHATDRDGHDCSMLWFIRTLSQLTKVLGY